MKTKLLLLLLLANFSIYAQTNLVSNGGFENWITGSPQNWTIANSVSSSTDKSEGQYSAKLSLTDKTLAPKVITQIQLKANITYTVRFKYKYVSSNYSGLHPIAIKIFQNGSGTTISKSVFASNNNWTLNEITFTPDQDLSYDLSISVFSFDDETFDVLIDDVSVIDPNEPEHYTLIPDVNFEKKLIALKIDSGTPDGKVLTSQISNITTIDLYFSNITDLTGIQDFKSLTSLSCMSNKIETLDISQNLALTNLNAGYNKLTTLNTSQNHDLQYLSLYYNQITNLDLSQNANLNLLSIGSNKLTQIDLSNNKKLSTLWCPLNQLTNLDLSKNTSLSSITCSENKLLTTINLKNGANSSMQLSPYSIDFTKNPSLTCILVDNALYSNKNWESFKDINASYSTIDCSQVTAIPDSNFEDKLIALNIDKDGKNGSVLNSSIINITSLDITTSAIKDLTGIKGFTNLNSLNCSGNRLSLLDLSQNTALTFINCSNNYLENLNLKNGNNTNFVLSSNLKNNPALNCIQVDSEVYANNNWSTLKDNSASYNLDCNVYTLIPDPVFEDKLIALEIDKDGKNGKVLNTSIKKVTSLDLSNSNISDITGIEDFTSLTYLDLSTNNLSKINVSKNTFLLKLDLNFNKITNLDVTANKELINLSFASNQISTIDLAQNKKLYYLTVDSNSLSALDLSANNELENISCGSNNLTTLDTSNHSNLLILLCALNQISALNLSNNPKLDILQCYSNNLTSLDLSHNKELTHLSAASNKLSSLDLSQNKKLVMVHLALNPLTTLNVQNGNNENFIVPPVTGKKTVNPMDYTSFLQIKTLSCIQVDNVAYSNAKWSGIKEASATYASTCKTLGLEDNVFDKVAIYPNPTKGEVNISNIKIEKATVYNSLGQLVKTFTLNSNDTNNAINLSGLPKGVYYVYLINKDAASAKKVILE